MNKEMSQKTFLIIFILIVIIGGFLRFYHFDLKPLHHDEGTSWYYINIIYSNQPLIYDPLFHGFANWYLAVIPIFLFGLSIFTLRIMAVFLSFIAIFFFYYLKKYLGTISTLITALFFAISPTFIYYSRQLSQYPFFIFFLFITFILLILYLNKFKNIYLYLFSIALALLFTSHDWALIFLAALISFIFFAYYFDFTDELVKNKIKSTLTKIDKTALIFAGLLFIYTVMLIMTNFFTNFHNLFSYLASFNFHFERTYNEIGHNKSFFYYLTTFWPIEIYAILGSILAVYFFKREIFSIFVGYWVLFSFFIFSMIPYKIPWIFIIVLLPMYILAGLTVKELFNRINNRKKYKIILISILILLFLLTLYNTINLNYLNPINKDNVLNYVGPTNDFNRLINDIFGNLNKDSKILVAAESYWPLPFYLRNNSTKYIDAKDDLKPYYVEYNLFIIDQDKSFDNTILSEVGTYELRYGYYIKILKKI